MSLRGLVILLFLAYLLIVPAISQTDIIAWILVVTVLVVLLSTTLLSIITWYRTRKNTSISLGLPGNNLTLVAKTPVSIVAILDPISLMPFVYMKVVITFGTSKDETVACELKGKFIQNKARLPLTFTFPHRGNYTVSNATWSVTDPFGFISLWGSFKIPYQTVTITPPPIDKASLPVFTSSFREGDHTPQIHEPIGDMFDLKKYHPSDGLKKIVWKIFARSGELLSRHPERTMTPEGSVCIFSFAPPYDDPTAALTYKYCKELEDVGVEICVGCLGMQSRSPARTSEDALTLMIESVWDGATYNQESIQKDITSFITQAKPLTPTRVVIMGDSNSTQASNGLELVGKFFESINIEPLFVIPKIVEAKSMRVRKNSFLRSLFVEKEIIQKIPQKKDSFHRIAAQQGWDVVAI